MATYHLIFKNPFSRRKMFNLDYAPLWLEGEETIDLYNIYGPQFSYSTESTDPLVIAQLIHNTFLDTHCSPRIIINSNENNGDIQGHPFLDFFILFEGGQPIVVLKYNWDNVSFNFNGSIKTIITSGTDIYVGGDFTSASTVQTRKIAKFDGSQWSELGGGFDDEVNSLLIKNDTLYAFGNFINSNSNIPTINAADIIEYNTTTSGFTKIGDGIKYAGQGISMAGLGNDLYIAGSFSGTNGSSSFTTSGFTKFDGSQWNNMGQGIAYFSGGRYNPVVRCIIPSNNDLYICGNFSSVSAETIVTGGIAKFDTVNQTWDNLGVPYKTVVSSAVKSGDSLCFISTDAASEKYLSAYNEINKNITILANLNSLNISANLQERMMIVSGNTLLFSAWSGTPATTLNLFYYNLSELSGYSSFRETKFTREPFVPSVANALNLQMYNDQLVVSGFFSGVTWDTGSDPNLKDIATWDGTSWVSIGNGLNGDIYGMLVSNNVLYVSGTFTANGNSEIVRYVAKLNTLTNKWEELNSNYYFQLTNNNIPTANPKRIQSLYEVNNNIYISGVYFYSAITAVSNDTGTTLNYAAKFNGTTWDALGDGLNDKVTCAIIHQSNIYIGGEFTTAGLHPISGVAQWDGSMWDDLSGYYHGNSQRRVGIGGGEGSGPMAMISDDVNLFIGGAFSLTYDGSNPFLANNIVRWTSTAPGHWDTLGGDLTHGGGVSAPTMVQVMTIQKIGNEFYVGGIITSAFTLSETVLANGIVKWNGSSWTPIGGSEGGVVSEDLSVAGVMSMYYDSSDSNFYLFGLFSSGKTSTSYVQGTNAIRWDGSQFYPIGENGNEGIVGTGMTSCSWSSDTLYVGGSFDTASGTTISAKNFAKLKK